MNENKDILSEIDVLSQINDFDLDNNLEDKELKEIIDPLDNISIESDFKVIEKKQEENDLLNDIEIDLSKQIKNTKKTLKQKITGNFIFAFKYILTTSLIFVVLLLVTNFSAYKQVVNSYLNPNSLENSKASLYESINSNSIQKVNANDEIVKEEVKKEEIEIPGNTTINFDNNSVFHSMDKLSTSRGDIDLQIDIVPYENRIVIPKIGKNIPMLEVEDRKVSNLRELDEIFMKELENGIVRYPGSALPGEVGNSFIFGHSSNYPWMPGDYNDVFALLDRVVYGDEVIVYHNQKKYKYIIREKSVIRPGDVGILKRNKGKSEITLMTCWPIGTTINRLIVIGELVEVK